ncbi:TPA: hypothetical protein HA251_05280 [Candidatus Woesearchaeota archaeon]|nr:hypothetical protein [Candidatus Woesearchaeota archaeon]
MTFIPNIAPRALRNAWRQARRTDSGLKRRVTKKLYDNFRGPLQSESKACFLESNENIEQIIAGVRPIPGDDILAICGSGDQAFALAEYGARVYAVDNDPTQIAYASARAEMLKKGDFEGFLTYKRTRLMDHTITYFTGKGRLEGIRRNLDRVSFHNANIFHLPQELDMEYVKIYLSNAHQYVRATRHKTIHNLMARLQRCGTVYAAAEIRQLEDCCGMSMRQEATTILRMRYGGIWYPTVYTKLAHTEWKEMVL